MGTPPCIATIFVMPATSRSEAKVLLLRMSKICFKFSGLALFCGNAQTIDAPHFAEFLLERGTTYMTHSFRPRGNETLRKG